MVDGITKLLHNGIACIVTKDRVAAYTLNDSLTPVSKKNKPVFYNAEIGVVIDAFCITSDAWEQIVVSDVIRFKDALRGAELI